MKDISQRIDRLDWGSITQSMHDQGFAVIPNFLDDEECSYLKSLYADQTLFRKKVSMERFRFGKGEYKYFDYPLPSLIAEIRTLFYPKLAPIANQWFRALKMVSRFPNHHKELIDQCKQNNQHKSTPLILQYGQNGYNTLHQDIYGDIYFPMQSVLFLDESEVDYSGGHFVLTEQIPRSQSKAIVLTPKKGQCSSSLPILDLRKGTEATIGSI